MFSECPSLVPDIAVILLWDCEVTLSVWALTQPWAASRGISGFRGTEFGNPCSLEYVNQERCILPEGTLNRGIHFIRTLEPWIWKNVHWFHLFLKCLNISGAPLNWLNNSIYRNPRPSVEYANKGSPSDVLSRMSMGRSRLCFTLKHPVLLLRVLKHHILLLISFVEYIQKIYFAVAADHKFTGELRNFEERLKGYRTHSSFVLHQ